MPIRSWMSSMMGQIETEHPVILPLNLEKLLNLTWFTLYLQILTISSTNINQSAPNLVKMYVTIRSRMSSSMDLTRMVPAKTFSSQNFVVQNQIQSMDRSLYGCSLVTSPLYSLII